MNKVMSMSMSNYRISTIYAILGCWGQILLHFSRAIGSLFLYIDPFFPNF